MCWKQEWAMAINNLQHAQEHIEKAQEKLHNRRLRNEKNLQRLTSSKKHNYPCEIAPVKELIEKNRLGEQECKDVIAVLKQTQAQLFRMIHVYGIKHSENPQRVYQLMGKYDVSEASAP